MCVQPEIHGRGCCLAVAGAVCRNAVAGMVQVQNICAGADSEAVHQRHPESRKSPGERQAVKTQVNPRGRMNSERIAPVAGRENEVEQ